MFRSRIISAFALGLALFSCGAQAPAFAQTPTGVTYSQLPAASSINLADFISIQPATQAGGLTSLYRVTASQLAAFVFSPTSLAANPGISGLSLSSLTLTNLTGLTAQCLVVNSAGVVSGTGGYCSGGGYIGAPQNIQNTYTLALSDEGKMITCASGATCNYTIPANSAVAFNLGDIVVFDNESANSVPLSINSDTLESAGTTGTQYLGPGTISTIVKVGTTTWRLNTGAASVNPSGTVIAYAANSAPTGYLICNGAAVSRTTYAALFAAIGTTYGAGDGSTTFNLPNLLGAFVRGYDSSGSVDPGRTFGTYQADAFASHSHLNGVGVTNGSGYPFVYGGTATGTPGSATTTAHTDANTAQAQGNTSATGGSETRPKNVAMTYLIKTAYHPANDNHRLPKLRAA